MKTDQLSKKISKVEEHRREWTQSQNYIQFRTQPCSYCGLTGVHPRGRNCPAYGVQCEICRKYNHFTSVCREKRKWIEPIDEAMRPPHCYTRMKRKDDLRYFIGDEDKRKTDEKKYKQIDSRIEEK